MSTQIFLGLPPPHVADWIKANYKPKATWVPATYTNQWLFSDGNEYKLTYTRYSQEQLDNFQESGMPELTCQVTLEASTGSQVQLNNLSIVDYESRGSITWDTSSGKSGSSTIPFDLAYKNEAYIADTITKIKFTQSTFNSDTLSWSEPTNVTGYQIYTPGHWEDADGNWINGSWSDKDTNEWIPIDCESFFAYWTDSVMGEHYDSFRWSVSVNGSSPQEPGNQNVNENFLTIDNNHGTRTWTNTVSEP